MIKDTDHAIHIVKAPKSSANDDVLLIVFIAVDEGQKVVDGQILVEVEGAKAVVEVTADRSGIVYLLAQHGDRVAVGQPVAAIVPEGVSRDDVLAYLAAAFGGAGERRSETAPVVAGTRFSKGAAELIQRNQLSPELFAGLGLVTAAMVEERIVQMDADLHWKPNQPKRGHNGRVVLIGGGYGAHQILSVLLFEEGSQAVAILDEDSKKHGRYVKGVQILGGLDLLTGLTNNGQVDSVICSAGGSIPFRRRVRQLAKKFGLPLANVIHPTVWFDDGVRIGQGNYFGAFCYIGADTVIGDNCFFSSGTTIEHHNRIGDEVTTGPDVATSGVVEVGNGVKFGTGVVVENRLKIGADSVIASNVAITMDIPARTVVKGRSSLRYQILGNSEGELSSNKANMADTDD